MYGGVLVRKGEGGNGDDIATLSSQPENAY